MVNMFQQSGGQSFPVDPRLVKFLQGGNKQLLSQSLLPQQQAIPVANPQAAALSQALSGATAPLVPQGVVAPPIDTSLEEQKQAPQVDGGSFLSALAEQSDIKGDGRSGAGDFLAGLLGGLQKGERARQARDKAKQAKTVSDRKAELEARKTEAEIRKTESESGAGGVMAKENRAEARQIAKEERALNKEIEKQKRASKVSGFEFKEGIIPTTDDAKKLKEFVATSANIENSINKLKKLVEGSVTTFGAEAAEAQGLQSDILTELNTIAKLGALSEGDREILERQALDPTSNLTRDSTIIQNYDNILNTVKSKVDNLASAGGYQPEGLSIKRKRLAELEAKAAGK